MTYTQAELDEQYLEQVPSLQIVQTVGGYYRVEVSGPDSLQSQVDRPRCFSADIARDLTKEGALRKAREWLDRMRDRTPQSSSGEPSNG